MLRVFEGRQIFTMTMTVTTSVSTVPEGSEGTKAEGNSRQWTLGRCFKIRGSKAVRCIKYGLKEGFYTSKLQSIDLHKRGKIQFTKVTFFCQKHREWSQQMHGVAQLQRRTECWRLKVMHKWLRCVFYSVRVFCTATRCPFLQSQRLLL